MQQAEEVDYLTAKVAALTKLDGNNKDLVAALESQVEAQQKTIDALKAANKASSGIEVISDKELKSYQKSLDDAKAQIAKLTARVSFWRHVAAFGLPAILIVGVAVGYVVGSH